MIRSFLPVGQGAFYTEQFDCGVNVVYDCGSSTSRSAIEKQIACTFEPREKIQAVFISHLHEDHINGLPFLLSHCCVERLYLPFLTEEEILLTRLIARLENTESEFLSKLIVDPYGAVQDYTLPVDTQTPEIFYVDVYKRQPYTSMLTTASAAIVVCGRPDLQEGKCEPYWPQDCGAAIENLLLQAKDLGYGTCWCGCYPTMDRVEKIQKILNTQSIPVSIVAVGVADVYKRQSPYSKLCFLLFP